MGNAGQAWGEEVDEDALVTAVTGGRIRGAVLDVYDGELAGRPPRPEFLELPQILLTPHLSGRGDTSMREPVRRLFAENLRRYLDGRPLLNVVDRERGYQTVTALRQSLAPMTWAKVGGS